MTGPVKSVLDNRLKIIHDESKTIQDYVKINRQFIEVYISDKSKVEIMVKNWYLQKAKERFHQLAKPLFEQFTSKYNLTDANYQLVIREMQKRWGSCTPKGKIILNPELIKAPKGCIEYVIIHELSHLIHHDHTQKFIDLQSKEMPDWEKWKAKLEKLLA
ncbi:M48 family peptidase [Dyadobacter psychrotolerans]|uniref:M48 family peptidase n=1 Tax=Dyadobacter psychrotolerans TaxID=2541721 RepID=A0A4R5DNE3_9BACT|nr:M48 family peptidase [Dyadobacter psychrotolerans]